MPTVKPGSPEPGVIPTFPAGFFRLAAPSWVVPGTILDNCLFLQGKVDEVGLLFMEAESCLLYGRHDLPPELTDLGFSFHVHLPVNLPWEKGGTAVAGICLALMDKVGFLDARRAVLHPPGTGERAEWLLEAFAASWRKAGRQLADVLLENIRENDLCGLGGLLGHDGFGVCPDLGHILAYKQDGLLALLAALPPAARPRMMHCTAPGSGLPGREPKSAHLPLDTLDAAGRETGRQLCSLLGDGGVLMAELFDWKHIERSLPLIGRWLAARNPDAQVE